MHFLLSLSKEQASGTFTAPDEGDPNGHIVFNVIQGHIRDVTFPGQSTLERTFQDSVSPSELKKAKKQAAKGKSSLGEALIKRGIITEDAAIEAVIAFVKHSVAQLLTYPNDAIKFTQGNQGEALFSDLGTNYDIYLPIEDLLIHALSSFEAWDFVVEHFSFLRDVYYATPNAVKYFHQQAENQDELAILQQIDGQKNIEEVITLSSLDPFYALDIVQQLAEEGIVELVNPVQLFQLGLDEEENGNWSKALHLYQRSLDRGLDDFDLQFRLAHAFEKTGKKNIAISRYLDFADKCAREFRFEDTLRALKRITILDCDNIPIRRRYIQLLHKYDKNAEAAEESLKLADTLQSKNRSEEALRILGEAADNYPEDLDLQEKYATLCEECKANDQLQETKERLTQIYSNRKDTTKALEYFQKLFIKGEDTLEIRLKLVELHLVQGNKEKALDHLDAVLAIGNPYGINDKKQLRELHQKRCELQPGERYSCWFLIENALSRNELATAETKLRELIAHLDPVKGRHEIVLALKKLVKIFPDNHTYRWQLAKELEKSQKTGESAKTLMNLAEIEKTKGNYDEARHAYEEVLRLQPYDQEAREEIAPLYEQLNEQEKLQREQRNLAILAILAGQIDKAQSLCREVVSNGENNAYLLVLLADLCAKTGDTKMAGDLYKRAGKALIAEHNFGLASECAGNLQELGSFSSHAEELQKTIEAALAGAGGNGTSAKSNGKADEAFSHMKERVLKRSVNSITARLKDLKGGGRQGKAQKAAGNVAAQPAVAASIKGRKVTSGVNSSINKLKSLGGAGGAKADKPKPDTPPPEKAPDTPAPPANDKPVRLGSAADKLKALKQGGGAPPPQSTGTASSAAPQETAPSGTPADGGKKAAPLGGAAARLKSLKNGGSPDAAQEKSRTAPQDSGGGPEVKKKLKLGSAASKLAQLRQ